MRYRHKLLIERNKFLYRSVIGALDLGREKAAGKLFSVSMIGYTLATFAFSVAGIVRAGTIPFIVFKRAVHNTSLRSVVCKLASSRQPPATSYLVSFYVLSFDF